MTDPIFKLIAAEKNRQLETLSMIASENFTYPEVFAAVGSALMQKYAEGQPGKRYYQGNAIIDQIETLCQKRALQAFRLSPDTWSVNVQALSGSPANLAVLNGLLSPGDTILSLSLPEGGHLSHGHQSPTKKITLVSKLYNVHFYHLDPATHLIDYAALEKQARQLKPKLIISGGTAYPRDIDYPRIGTTAHAVGAYYLADIAHEAGLIAGGALASPFSHADAVTLTTHKTLRGPRGALIFMKKNLAPAINASVFPGIQGGPHFHTIAGIAIALHKATTPEFRHYAKQTIKNAQTLARELTHLGYHLISGGTDKHLLLIDLRPQKISGKTAAELLEKNSIIVNKNTIPGDTGTPTDPSGIRLGVQALTARGMGESEMKTIAHLIHRALSGEDVQALVYNLIHYARDGKEF